MLKAIINKHFVPFQLQRFILLWEDMTQNCIRCKDFGAGCFAGWFHWFWSL